jgi:hypothetical protein
MVGHFDDKKNPRRSIDYECEMSCYSIEKIATQPGVVFTKNTRMEGVFPKRIECSQDRFWVEYSETNDAIFIVPIQEGLPQRDVIEKMPRVEVEVILQTASKTRPRPTVKFLFVDTVNEHELAICTTDRDALGMQVSELARMSYTRRATPFRYLAAHEGRTLDDMLKVLQLTEQYYFHGIIVESLKGK